MKKIFTLLTMALLAIGAQAQSQTISWSEAIAAADLAADATFSSGDFVLSLTDTDNKMAIDGNNVYFGTAESSIKFTYRLKSGGKSSAKNAMALTVPSPGTLKVYARTGSSSATDRYIALNQNGTELVKKTLLEDDAISVDMEENISEENPTGSTKVYPVIEVEVKKGIVNVTYPVGSVNFYGFEFISSGEVTPSTPTAATVWDFTQDLSTADATNLAADTETWAYDDENGYWSNLVVLAERNEFTALSANGQELEVTKGLTFARDDKEGLAAGRIKIAPAKNLAINGSKVTMNLGVLVENDVVKLRFKGAGESERSLTAANATVTEGSLTTADTEVHEVTLKVGFDGTVSLTTGNGFQFQAIAINDDLPEEETTGISTIKAETAADAPVYNLQGQRVDENYRGVVIKNGKKMIK